MHMRVKVASPLVPPQELLTVLILAKHPRLQQHLMAAQLGPVLPEEEEERKWDAIAVRSFSDASFV